MCVCVCVCVCVRERERERETEVGGDTKPTYFDSITAVVDTNHEEGWPRMEPWGALEVTEPV